MDRTVLVIGGAGYVGSHTCKALAANGYVPVSFDNLSNGHVGSVQWGPFVEGDILDPVSLDAVFKAFNPIAVIHFAALIEVGESVRRPDLFYRTNVTGALNVLEAMRANGCDKIVFSSTCAVHGDVGDAVIVEDMLIQPISPYAKSKAAVEGMLADYAVAYGVNATALRYFNASGADPEGQLGEEHDPETHLIPLACQAALGNRDGMFVYGDDYATPDGTCVRDYVHVTDLATAHVAALSRLLSEQRGFDVFCLGAGIGTSVLEALEAVRRVSDETFPIWQQGRRQGDAPQLVANVDKANRVLGWSPRMSDIDTIVRTAWNWHKSRV